MCLFVSSVAPKAFASSLRVRRNQTTPGRKRELTSRVTSARLRICSASSLARSLTLACPCNGSLGPNQRLRKRIESFYSDLHSIEPSATIACAGAAPFEPKLARTWHNRPARRTKFALDFSFLRPDCCCVPFACLLVRSVDCSAACRRGNLMRLQRAVCLVITLRD